jgi:hypothetical protein
MSTHAIIDGDTIVYAVGFAHDKATENNGGVEEPIANLFGGVKMTIASLLGAVGADSYELFLTGHSNFRMDVFPDYKANRIGIKQPTRKAEIRDYLVRYKGGVVINGMEADDACGIAMYSMPASKTVLIHQDKDLDMLRGNHYNWHKCHKDNGIYNISEEEADKIFYRQLLKGDSVDNIPGLFRMTGKKATAKVFAGLDSCLTEKQMYDYCLAQYDNDSEVLERLAQLIYIRRDSIGWVNPHRRGK